MLFIVTKIFINRQQVVEKKIYDWHLVSFIWNNMPICPCSCLYWIKRILHGHVIPVVGTVAADIHRDVWLTESHNYAAFLSYTWWRHQMETSSALLAFCVGNSPVAVNSPHQGQWRGALMFSLICAWINDWVNNGEAGDLRCHCAYYDITVMNQSFYDTWSLAMHSLRTINRL